MKKILGLVIFITCFLPRTSMADTDTNCKEVRAGKSSTTAKCLPGTTEPIPGGYYYENAKIQTFGPLKCVDQDKTLPPYVTLQCKKAPNTTEPTWHIIDTNFCTNSTLRNRDIANGYYIIFNDEEWYAYGDTLSFEQSRYTYQNNPCLHVGCADDYVAENNQCVDINSVKSQMCQPGKPKTSDWPTEEIYKFWEENYNFDCSGLGVGEISDTSQCLKTSENLAVYCVYQSTISLFATPETRKKTCISYVFDQKFPHITLDSTTTNYWCTDNNKWIKQEIPHCDTPVDGINDFADCNGRENCIKKIYTSATSTTPLAFTNNVHRHTRSLSADLCYRYVCKDGYQRYANLCESNEYMETTKEFCHNTGGEWIEGTLTCFCEPNKNLKSPEGTLNSFCECIDNEHELDILNPSNGCIKIDSVANKEACDAADNATWVPASAENETGKCVCNEEGYYWQWNTDTKTGRCKLHDNYVPCINAENTRWNRTTNECECTNGGQEFRNGQCVDTEETINRKANDASSAITTAVNTLTDLISGANLQTSKWKNAEGKFNTARLASDATAGIVLGTTSALITSKLVKKHQVQDGFEDIHCTIGGQTVADWGDEFTIGIQ